MFIVEGSDCLGKTTAIQKMRKMVKDWNPPVMYSHMGRPNEFEFNFASDYACHIHRYVIQDRFHLGGIVWHNCMTPGGLKFVESCLKLVDSFVVVFFTSDEDWYAHALRADTRSQLFDIPTLLVANMAYANLSSHPLNPWVDVCFDIQDGRFPEEDYLKILINQWEDRLNAAK